MVLGLVYTEMVSAKGLYYNDEKTKLILDTTGEKRPVAFQIFGNDPQIMGITAKSLSNQCEILDINMGCPAPKVTKNGDGSKLLLNLKLIQEIIENVVKNSSVPVTVKIRKGWDEKNIVAVEVAKIAEGSGASAITIHGRTKDDYYGGKVDLDIIKKVKESVKIPVIGNGDITTPEEAKYMLEYTGVDGIMIGRGALGNPWVFREVIEYLKDGIIIDKPSNEEKLQTILKHIDLATQNKPEIVAVKELRKHLSWYVKNLKDASKLRVEINKIETKKELENVLIEYFEML